MADVALRQHIAADCGRDLTKALSMGGKVDPFPSWVGTARTRKLENPLIPTDNILQTDFGTFFVGTLAVESEDRRRLMVREKVHRDTKIFVLTLISRLLAAQHARITLTLGVPINQANKDVKQALEELLLGSYALTLNGVQKRFTIDRLQLVHEGAAASRILFPNAPGTQRLIDIGSRTVNFATIVNGRYRDLESDTLDYGAETIESGPALANRIIGDLSRYWGTFQDDTYALGGGILKDGVSATLKEALPKLHIPEDPRFLNVRAFFEIGEKAAVKA